MMNNTRTTLLGVLVGLLTIVINYIPVEYKDVAIAVQGALLGLLGYHSMDKR